MSAPSSKTLRSRTAEFVQDRKGIDKDTLIEFVAEVVHKQETLTVTAHRNDEGEVDCICLGDLCNIKYVPTEQMLKCKRLEWIYVGEKREEERERRDDYIDV